jgi:arylsulfatase A-like enzyme
VIRSFSHGNGDHWAAAHWMLTGRTGANGADRMPRYPSMGAVAAHLLGPTQSGSLANVNMNDGGFGFHGAAWLGVNHNPFRYGDFSYGNEAGQLPTGDYRSFSLTEGLSEGRLMDRVSLRQQLDSLKHRIDKNRLFDQMDAVDHQAMDLVLSGRVRKAFDVSDEDPGLRERYGAGWGEQALLARRLIEAGVRYVSLNTGYFDDHSNIEPALKDKLPRHDKCVGVLIQDLAERGMLDDTLVVVAGEFGHTPRINGNAGRDHWPQAQSLLLAGGGYRHGQVIGSTNDKAEYPTSRQIGVEDFCAIVYHAMGLKVDDSMMDLSGRPTHLVPGGQVPVELL